MAMIVFGPSVTSASLTPTETVQETIATVMNILNDPI